MRASIIALCYNHESFLEEALLPLEKLPAGEVEIIICDDASSDGSRAILEKWINRRPDWKFLLQDTNQGNCRTFNLALAQSSGARVLDLATDDVLIPDAFMRWLSFAEKHPEAGFIYADAFVFSKKKEESKRFSDTVKQVEFPEGNIFPALFKYHFICPPAVLFHAEKLRESGAYQERLAYEDWDIWLRLSGRYPVRRFAEPVVHYRQHSGSLSASLLRHRNKKLPASTLMILEEVMQRPEFSQVAEADFIRFVRYHLRLCFFLQLPEQAAGFLKILESRSCAGIPDRLMAKAAGKAGFIYPLYRILKSL